MSAEKTLSTGELDPSFGQEGLAHIHSPDPNYPDYFTLTIAIDPNNNIYAAGQAAKGLNNSIYTLARLDENGAIDTTFADRGYFSDFFHLSDQSHFFCSHINFLNGKVLLSGHLYYYENDRRRRDKAAVCFLANGKIDETFAERGKFIFRASPDEKYSGSTAAYEEARLEEARYQKAERGQPRRFSGNPPVVCTVTDKHILLLHSEGSFEAIESSIIRLDHQGKLDRTFGGVGFVRVSHSAFPFLSLRNLIVSDDGSYISAGDVKVGYSDIPDAIVLVKHRADGTLDTTFQHGGFLLLPSETPGQFFILEKMVKQPNNRVLCLGLAFDQNTQESAALLISREADGSSNIQFNNGNPVLTDTQSSFAFWINADFQLDGSILTTAVVEQSGVPSNYYGIARFLSNGTHDKSYGDGNGWLNYYAAQHERWHASAISNNSCVLSVEEFNGDAIDSAIARGLMP